MSFADRDVTLETESRGNYLYAHITSSVNSAGVLLRAFSKIIPECRSLGLNRLLVVHDTGTELTTTDAFDAAVGVADLDVAGIRIAYVDAATDHLESNRFGELVAGNRGVQGKVFSDTESAEAWLLE